jgi:hypothetical protein
MHYLLLATNVLLLFFALFGQNMLAPLWLQLAGRLHPLLLHFPIVCLIFMVVWENWPATRQLPAIGDKISALSAVSAVFAALSGLFLSKEGCYELETLDNHQWSGVVCSLLAWGWFELRAWIRQSLWGRTLCSVGILSMIVWTGHLGAQLTHGAAFLWEPALKKSHEPPHPSEANIYTDLVQPILSNKCGGCHNAGKRKGDLNMNSYEMLTKGGKNGALWDTTAADLGLMMRRIHLPVQEKEHMPPAGKTPLTDIEIEILEQWIRLGAPADLEVSTLPETHPLRLLVSETWATPTEESWDFPPADEADIRRLNNAARSVRLLTEGAPALRVSFFGISTFHRDLVSELQPVRRQVVEMNLNRMPFGDEDLGVLAQFANLQKLNLSATKISGKNLGGVIGALKNLRQLSLAETGVGLDELSFLGEMPALKQVFLWNSDVRDSASFQALRRRFPGIRFEDGFRDSGTPIRLNAPVIETPQEVFTSNTKVRLKNYIRGARVYYTLDGSLPDSLHALPATNDSISIDQTCLLRARSFLTGWVASEVSERQFFKVGVAPDSTWLTNAPNPQYKGEGARTLFNQKIGDTDFRTPQWIAFRETPAEIWLEFAVPREIKGITLGGLVDIGSYIMPPASIEIWGGNDKKSMSLLHKIQPEQPGGLGKLPQKKGYTLSFPARSVRWVKVVAYPVSRLPAWHPGKGERAWVFLDEIFL